MAIIESGDGSGHKALVDTAGNQQVTLPQEAALSGFVRLLDGDANEIITTENGALMVSQDNLLFFEQVDGSNLNTNIWTTSVSTMTIGQTGGYITLNSGSSLTSNVYAILQSVKYLPMYSYLPLRISVNARVPIAPGNNLLIEMGIGAVAGVSAPTDGAMFRWNSVGQLLAVVNNNGTETTAVLSGAYSEPDGDEIVLPPTVNDCHLYEIVVVEDEVQFFVDDVKAAAISVPAGLAYPVNSGRLPIFARVANINGSPSFAPQLSIGQVTAVQQGVTMNRPWSEMLASLGRGAHQSPVTAFGQTANHVNSTSPSSAALSNTAAGYTTLGGRYQFAAVVGAATDYALFAFQVPTGYQLFVTGINISATVLGIAVVTATVLDWGLGVNGSAVSLATAESPPTTWAPRRIPLGVQGLLALAGIGQGPADLNRRFDPPLVVDSARYLHVILQVPSGAATASLIIRGNVSIQGYFE